MHAKIPAENYREAEAGGSLSVRPAWCTRRVQRSDLKETVWAGYMVLMVE